MCDSVVARPPFSIVSTTRLHLHTRTDPVVRRLDVARGQIDTEGNLHFPGPRRSFPYKSPLLHYNAARYNEIVREKHERRSRQRLEDDDRRCSQTRAAGLHATPGGQPTRFWGCVLVPVN